MGTAAGAAFTVGKQALDTLNNWMDDVYVAKSWCENKYGIFIGLAKWPPRRVGHLKITRVFTRKKK
jgi:hypothetical protein